MLGKKVHDELLDEEVKVKKKVPLIAVIGVAVVFILVMFLILGRSKSKESDGLNYYDTLTSLFTQEIGSFRYAIDVRTGEKGSMIVQNTSSGMGLSDLNKTEGIQDDDSNEPEDSGNKFEFSDWEESKDVRVENWEYPNYKIIIDGCTTSTEPLNTTFTVSLATQYYNNKLTEVTCYNGNYYIDIESLRTWLVSSKDEYLIELGSALPQGSKYLMIPEDEFFFTSRYAESGEEEYSKLSGMRNLYKRGVVTMLRFSDRLKSSLGTTGFNYTDDSVSLVITGDNGTKFVNALKNVILKYGDFYDIVMNSYKSNNILSDTQELQMKREKDNVLDAFSDMFTGFNAIPATDMQFNAEGYGRNYKNGQGADATEVTFACSFTTLDTDYAIQFTGVKEKNTKDIMLPNGSTMTMNKLIYPNLVHDTVFNLVKYLNISSIKLENRLEVTPDSIREEIVSDFITLVNNTGCFEEEITEDNLEAYIQRWMLFEETDKSTSEELVNKKLVMDFIEVLNGITGGLIVEKEVYVKEEVAQYPDCNFEVNGVVFNCRYDAENSSAGMLVLDIEVCNKTDEYVHIDPTDFSVKTLLNSTYPANNEIIIKNYDGLFDLKQLPNSTTLEPYRWITFKTYHVLSDDDGHMDLFYQDTKYGSIIEY